jgi:hypothetical protein
MGSRKKKKIAKSNLLMRTWGTHTVDQKIAFKAFCWHYGRMRLSFHEFKRSNFINSLGPLGINNCISDGYTWLH